MAEGVSTARELQARFNELRDEHGTVGALELLLEGEYSVQNEEMRAIVQRTIGTARSLVTALPGREDVVTRLLDGANLNLGAATNAGAFADFLTAVNASEDLSEAEKQTLREVVGVTLNDHHPTNATELQSALREGRGTERVQVGTETVEDPPGSGNWVERPVYEVSHPECRHGTRCLSSAVSRVRDCGRSDPHQGSDRTPGQVFSGPIRCGH